MKISYKKLWVMLVERDLKKTEFAKKAKISSASLAKLGKGANVTTDVLVKICSELKFRIFVRLSRTMKWMTTKANEVHFYREIFLCNFGAM